MHALKTLLVSRWYWAGLALLGLFMEAVALYYQYVVGDEPCQICIQTRIWVAAFTLVGIVMCLLPRQRVVGITAHLLVITCAAGLWERSWYLYQLENGRGGGSCQFYLGFPDWFALDRWFPALFEVRNLCGFTPELLWGISMAEGLIAIATVLVLLALTALYAAIVSGRPHD